MSRLLVVVDMQKDFVDGALGSPEAQAIVPHVIDKIKAYQGAGQEVVFTLDTHFDDYMDTMEGKKLPVIHCVKGTPGWELTRGLRGLRENVLRRSPLAAANWLIMRPLGSMKVWN